MLEDCESIAVPELVGAFETDETVEAAVDKIDATEVADPVFVVVPIITKLLLVAGVERTVVV